MKKVIFNFVYPFAKIYWFIFRPKTFGVKCLIKCGNEILMIRHTYGIYGFEIAEAKWFDLANLPVTNSIIAREVIKLWREKK